MAIPLNSAALPALPAGVTGPDYDRSRLTAGILHIGVGNFHRAHMAVYLDRLMGFGEAWDWAIVGAGVRPADAAMRARLQAQDWLSTVVELDPRGLSARVIGPMVDFVALDAEATVAGMADPAVRIVSLTVTEGGYFVDATGGFDATHPEIAADAGMPDAPATAFGMILQALRLRRARGHPPFTVLSCDNLPGNGKVTCQTLAGLAGLSDPAFAAWIRAEVAFPNTMVDCIAPAVSDRLRSLVRERFGLVDAAPVACEPFRQWVLEDHFPAGRPAFEQVGVEFVADVTQHELMKLRILNGGHAAIAYASALLGYRFVHQAMADPLIAAWLRALEAREIIPTLAPIAGVSYAAYLATIVGRFANPEIGDTVARLCLDGSNRQPKFILPTLSDALERGMPYRGLALEVALWCRYCAGTDEAGAAIPPNDERAADLKARALQARGDPAAFLANSEIFGALGQVPKFRHAFAQALSALWTRGVRGVLEDYLRVC